MTGNILQPRSPTDTPKRFKTDIPVESSSRPGSVNLWISNILAIECQLKKDRKARKHPALILTHGAKLQNQRNQPKFKDADSLRVKDQASPTLGEAKSRSQVKSSYPLVQNERRFEHSRTNPTKFTQKQESSTLVKNTSKKVKGKNHFEETPCILTSKNSRRRSNPKRKEVREVRSPVEKNTNGTVETATKAASPPSVSIPTWKEGA